MIELKSVSKVFQTKDIETRALDDICLKINSSEFVSIMGPSGCGKSTLLNLIGLLDQPTAGTILIHDTDVSRMSDREAARFRNKSLGFVFQNFHLVPSLNVMDNVELPVIIWPGCRCRKERAGKRSLEYGGVVASDEAFSVPVVRGAMPACCDCKSDCRTSGDNSCR